MTAHRPFPNTGRAIRDAREQLGWTQAKFAERAVLADGTIKASEAGRRITCKTHRKLVDTLNHHRARATPPLAPVDIPYPSDTAGENLPAQAQGPATPSGRPMADPLANPHLLAIFEALKHTAPKTEARKSRIGEIRSVAELSDLWRIDNSAYGDGNITHEHFLGLWKAFPAGLRVLFHENEIMGALGIWPVTSEWVEQLKAAQFKEAQLDCHMVRQAAKMPARYWYVTGLMLREELIGRGGGVMKLLNGTLRAWLADAQLSYPCEILALAYSDHGARILKRFNFHILQHAADMPDGCDLYGLCVDSRKALIRMLRERNLDLR